MGKLIDVDKFLERVKKDREHEIYLHSWTADMVLERLDSWYAPTVEAIPKDQYEARLKADLEDILDDLQLKIEEHLKKPIDNDAVNINKGIFVGINEIQQKINALREDRSEEDGATIN